MIILHRLFKVIQWISFVPLVYMIFTIILQGDLSYNLDPLLGFLLYYFIIFIIRWVLFNEWILFPWQASKEKKITVKIFDRLFRVILFLAYLYFIFMMVIVYNVAYDSSVTDNKLAFYFWSGIFAPTVTVLLKWIICKEWSFLPWQNNNNNTT